MPELASIPRFLTADQCWSRPSPGEVHLWRIPLAAPPPRTDLLSPAERDQHRRFHRAEDRDRYLVSHDALRRILGRYPGVSEVTFTTGPWGKPALANGALEFNLSHSGKFAVLAISGDAPVGVDLECHRLTQDLPGLASRVFTPEERSYFESLPAAGQTGFFHLAWTVKEAVLKALGTGLSIEPTCVHLPIPPDRDPLLMELRAHNQQVSFQARTFDIADGYTAAVASPRPLTTLSFFEHAC